MFSRLNSHFKNFDWLIFAAIFILIAIGLVEIYSVALGQGEPGLLNFYKQLIFIGVGLVLFFSFSLIDSYFLKSLNAYFFILAILILLAVLIFGDTIRGTKGWFYIFGFGIQPVEFAKITLILLLANYFSGLATKVKTWHHFLISTLPVALLGLLVLLQPDFGSALILGGIWLVIIMAAGFNKKYFIFIALSILLIFTMSWFFFFRDYQKERISNFFNPGSNSQDSGYNISQAIIAIGSGGLVGKGISFGSQSQLRFLPEAQNDFIFAVISEELGFFGSGLVVFLYGLLFYRIWRALPKINNDFGIYFLIGAGGLIFIQMFINIGMNLGIVPVVGLSLPFVSYGGSSLLSMLMLGGIVENIIIKSRISY